MEMPDERTYHYLVLHKIGTECFHMMEIEPIENAAQKHKRLQAIGRFVISAMEAMQQDEDVEDVAIEIFASALTEDEHLEAQNYVPGYETVEDLIRDPRTFTR